jgi:hypothetical protein
MGVIVKDIFCARLMSEYSSSSSESMGARETDRDVRSKLVAGRMPDFPVFSLSVSLATLVSGSSKSERYGCVAAMCAPMQGQSTIKKRV